MDLSNNSQYNFHFYKQKICGASFCYKIVILLNSSRSKQHLYMETQYIVTLSDLKNGNSMKAFHANHKNHTISHNTVVYQQGEAFYFSWNKDNL